MKKVLVTYFSASGQTKKVAQNLADSIGADIHEITPKVAYTSEDLDWTNKKSRSSVEMSNKFFRPEIESNLYSIDEYDVVFVGFPIWWYVAPKIINTFLESFDFDGKTVIPFATSGGSGIGNTNIELAPSCKGAMLKDGKVFNSSINAAELKSWGEQFIK